MSSYRAWRADEFAQYDEDERADNAWDPHKTTLYSALRSPRECAELFADYCHARRDGWEWSWPIDVIVHDGEQYWQVEVSRDMCPEFIGGCAKPYAVTPEATP
jgi:hypothetical protein